MGLGVHVCLGLVFVPTLPTPLVRLLCQAIADAQSCTIADLLKPIAKVLDSILDRRLQPVRSITAQVVKTLLALQS